MKPENNMSKEAESVLLERIGKELKEFGIESFFGTKNILSALQIS